MNRKLNILNKQCFSWKNVQYQKLQQMFEVLSSFCLDNRFCHAFNALSMMIVVRNRPRPPLFEPCYSAAVVMETVQLTWSQFKYWYFNQL